jgi:hypothetical protein
MFRRTLFAPLALALALFTAACEEDGTGPDREQERFVATLSGQNERPTPVSTGASGIATFTVGDDGMSVDFGIDVSNITGVTGVHIHGPAGVDESAGVIVPLFANAGTGTVNGNLVRGTFTQSEVKGMTLAELLELLRNGRTYVNVHTLTNKPGEIRGQIQRQ